MNSESWRFRAISARANPPVGVGEEGEEGWRMAQMRKTEGNSGHLANKSRKRREAKRWGTDRQTEIKYQWW